MNKNTKKGQSIIEYSMLIVIIIGVLLSVGTYFKRGVQGRWKDSVDQLGDQYHPGKTTGVIDYNTTVQSTTIVEGVEEDGGTKIRTDRRDSTISRETKTGYMNVSFE